MDILRHRPLFACAALFMLVSTVAPFLSVTEKCLAGSLIFAGVILYALWRILRRRDAYHALLAVLAGILVCLALLRSCQAFQNDRARHLQARMHTEVRVTGTVVDRRATGGYFSAYALMLETVDEVPADGLALLTCHYTSDLRPGEQVDMQATLLPLSDAVGDGYDATTLRGDGYVAGLLSEDEAQVTVTARDSGGLAVRMGNIRRTLAARLALMTGDRAGGLPSALLLGEKTTLADGVRRDFSRAGVAHLLAISGLHMTLLFGVLGWILARLGLSKRVRAVLLGVSAVGYLFLLGFPPSATRAVIMLGVTYLSYVFFEQADPLTSLGLAGAVILAVTPYAVWDAGFWMSFLATLGLLTVLPLLQAWLRTRPDAHAHPWRSLLREDLLKLLTAVLVGLVAVSFTLLVVASVIGELGILSPVSTLLLTPLFAPILLLSLLCLPLLGTPLGGVLGQIVSALCALMAEAAAWLAEPAWVVVSLRHHAVVPVAAAMTAATLLLLVIRLPIRRRMMVLLPMLVGWVAIGGVLTAHRAATLDRVDVSYIQPSSVSESLVLVSGNRGFVCDLSNGFLSAMSAAVREAEEQGATELAVLMLTHYHTRTPGALSILLQRETVRALWLPVPVDAAEYDVLISCTEKAEAADVPIHIYRPQESLRVFGDGELTAARTWLSRSTQPVLLVSLDVSPDETGKDRLLYCGSSVFESELSSEALALLPSADTVIFGSHGPKIHASYGGEATYAPDAQVILSASGDTAAWFDPQSLPDGERVWLGQKRFHLTSH